MWGNRVPYVAIYSDLDETLSRNYHAINVLENVTDTLTHLDPAAHEAYTTQRALGLTNNYHEKADLPGDAISDKVGADGNTPGWVLDRYKFLPMLAHAHREYPQMEYYVYIEDDTFVFWENMLDFLSTLSVEEVTYFGAYSGSGNATFAQGGSGIVFPRGMMEKVLNATSNDTSPLRSNPPTLEEYGNLTKSACCGDMVLGHILRDYGIRVNRGEYGSVSFRPEPPWRTGFDEANWCLPVFTFHHVHQKDIAQLAELETAFTHIVAKSKPVLFRDVYARLIEPHLTQSQIRNWDNFAAQWVIEKGKDVHPDMRKFDVGRVVVDSADECRKACEKVPGCVSWRFDDKSCALDTAVRWGRSVYYDTPEENLVSGWLLERIQRSLLSTACS
ncbi:hypothetical protein MMC25_000823 [Agyrium rufum]|nr:hypothetical protein [Agyrium rufum]